MPSRDVNAATRLAEAMYSPSSGFTGMGLKNMPNLVTYDQWFYEQDKQEAQGSHILHLSTIRKCARIFFNFGVFIHTRCH